MLPPAALSLALRRMPLPPQPSVPSEFVSSRVPRRCRSHLIWAWPANRLTSWLKRNGGDPRLPAGDQDGERLPAGVGRQCAHAAGFAGGIAVVADADGNGERRARPVGGPLPVGDQLPGGGLDLVGDLPRAGVGRRCAGAAGFAGGIVAVVANADGGDTRSASRNPAIASGGSFHEHCASIHPIDGRNRAPHEPMAPCGRAGSPSHRGNLVLRIGVASGSFNAAIRQHHLGSSSNPGARVRLRPDRADILCSSQRL